MDMSIYRTAGEAQQSPLGAGLGCTPHVSIHVVWGHHLNRCTTCIDMYDVHDVHDGQHDKYLNSLTIAKHMYMYMYTYKSVTIGLKAACEVMYML